jgi:hypothetical protein
MRISQLYAIAFSWREIINSSQTLTVRPKLGKDVVRTDDDESKIPLEEEQRIGRPF